MKNIGCVCLSNKIDSICLDTVDSFKLRHCGPVVVCYVKSDLQLDSKFKRLELSTNIEHQVLQVALSLKCKKIYIVSSTVIFDVHCFHLSDNYHSKKGYIYVTRKRIKSIDLTDLKIAKDCPPYSRYMGVDNVLETLSRMLVLRKNLGFSLTLNYNQVTISCGTLYSDGVTLVLYVDVSVDRTNFREEQMRYMKLWSGPILFVLPASTADCFHLVNNSANTRENVKAVVIDDCVYESSTVVVGNLFTISKHVETDFFVPLVFGRTEFDSFFERKCNKKRKPALFKQIESETLKNISHFMTNLPYKIKYSPANVSQIYSTRIFDEIEAQNCVISDVYQDFKITESMRYFYYVQGTGRMRFYTMKLKHLKIYENVTHDKVKVKCISTCLDQNL